MSNTELVTIAASRTVTNTTTTLASEPCARASLRRPEDVEDEPTSDGRAEQGLGPVDRGAAAWRLLWAAFMFEALLWSKFPLCIELSRHGS